MPDQPATPGTMPPDLVNAIVRDMDDPRYPTRIGIYCDTCHVTESHEYMVSDDMDRTERLGVARAHMRTQGWQCGDGGDFCPEHAGSAQ